jgi:hypothetical protein
LKGTDDWGLAVTANGEPVAVFCAHRGTHLQHFDRAHANARLIALAPNMYGYLTMKAADGDKYAEAILLTILEPQSVSVHDAETDGWRN